MIHIACSNVSTFGSGPCPDSFRHSHESLHKQQLFRSQQHGLLLRQWQASGVAAGVEREDVAFDYGLGGSTTAHSSLLPFLGR